MTTGRTSCHTGSPSPISPTRAGRTTRTPAPGPSTCPRSSGTAATRPARGSFGLHNITATNDSRAYATSIPPSNLYKILTPCCINYASFNNSTPTAAALESYVQHAEAEASPNPGWVIFFFHRICDNCGGDDPAPSMSPSEFNAFLDWLTSSSSGGATVKTVAQVIKGDTQPPATTIGCGGASCSSGWYGGPVTVSLSASDSGTSGVFATHYTTDGSEPTVASPLYTGPFTVSASGATTVKFRSWDNANNLEATKSQTIRVDTTAPSSTISCNNAPCSTSAYSAAVTVALSATDAESGVSVIRYTTDGSDPTASSTAYGGPFTVSSTTTIKYRAWDNAGNVEADEYTAHHDHGRRPGHHASGVLDHVQRWPSAQPAGTSAVSVGLSATRHGGSGVASIHYTTDGSDPTLVEPDLHGAVHGLDDHDREVPRLGQRGERRADEEPADPDRHDCSDNHDQLQQRDVLDVRLLGRGHRGALGDRRRERASR